MNETNHYGSTKCVHFKCTNFVEIKKFIATTILTCYVKLPKLNDYWSNDVSLDGRAICSSIMPRIRFYTLMKHLNLANNDNIDPSNKLFEIQEFIDLFLSSCKLCYRPEKKICIYKSLVPFRGRIR